MVKPWTVQKELLQERVPSPEEVVILCNSIPGLREKALFALAYLTTARISEVLDIAEPQLKIKEVQKNGVVHRILLIEDAKTRKNRRRKYRDLPIRINDHRLSSREPLVNIVLVYAATRKGQLLFPSSHYPDKAMSVDNAELLLKEYAGMNPHFIVHIGSTHLMKYVLRGNTFKYMKWRGHSDTRQADRYAEAYWEDMA